MTDGWARGSARPAQSHHFSPLSDKLAFSLQVVGSTDGAVHLEHLVVVGQRDLGLVLRLLVVAPGGLAVPLRLRHALVLLLHGLLVGGLPRLVLVLEHATHAQNRFLLRRVRHLLLVLELLRGALLPLLLVRPVPLILRVQLHPLVVHCTGDRRWMLRATRIPEKWQAPARAAQKVEEFATKI